MNRLLKLASCAALACAVSMAHASSITSATVYENTPNPMDASAAANMSSSLGHADFTLGPLGINFNTGGGTNTVATFLNNPTFFNVGGPFSSGAALNAGSGPTATGTELVIKGFLTLNAGMNSFVLGHDDGVVLTVAGNKVVNAPQPTGFNNTPFNVNSATTGDFAFELDYSECCSLPANLVFNVNNIPVGATPEPSTLALLGTGLLGACGAVRRRFARTV